MSIYSWQATQLFVGAKILVYLTGESASASLQNLSRIRLMKTEYWQKVLPPFVKPASVHNAQNVSHEANTEKHFMICKENLRLSSI